MMPRNLDQKKYFLVSFSSPLMDRFLVQNSNELLVDQVKSNCSELLLQDSLSKHRPAFGTTPTKARRANSYSATRR